MPYWFSTFFRVNFVSLEACRPETPVSFKPGPIDKVDFFRGWTAISFLPLILGGKGRFPAFFTPRQQQAGRAGAFFSIKRKWAYTRGHLIDAQPAVGKKKPRSYPLTPSYRTGSQAWRLSQLTTFVASLIRVERYQLARFSNVIRILFAGRPTFARSDASASVCV